MAESMLTITIDGRAVSVPAGTSLAAALWNQGVRRFRDSVSGAPRAPLCGMGICYECRVTVDGRPGERSCTLPCRDGMVVETPGGEADHG